MPVLFLVLMRFATIQRQSRVDVPQEHEQFIDSHLPSSLARLGAGLHRKVQLLLFLDAVL
jgi:hypothetical protein